MDDIQDGARTRRVAEQDEREKTLDQRELDLEETSVQLEFRETAADDRDRIADGRDHVADDRDLAADRREELADTREARLNEQEDRLEARKRALDERARRLGDASPDDLQRRQDAISRTRETLERSSERLARSQGALDRVRAGTARQEAAINREVEISQQRGAATAMTPGDDPEAVVTRFNDRINARDLDGLALVMTDEHAFIDKDGNRVDGKPSCLDAWRGFFDAYPDYRNHFAAMAAVGGGLVAVAGRSVCSEPALHGPALWTARVRAGQVSEWRVYDDTAETRARIGLPAGA